MKLTPEELENQLAQRIFATVVTQGPDGLASRTMLIGFDKGRGIFLLTRKSTEKMSHIANIKEGLVHIGEIAEDLTASYDIRLVGRFAVIEPGSDGYVRGSEVLGAKNPMIKDLLASSMAEDYAMLLFNIDQASGWTYQQAVDGLPKTVLD